MVFKELFEVLNGIEIILVCAGEKDPGSSGGIKIMNGFLTGQLPGLFVQVKFPVRTPDIADYVHPAII
jgi:hypothetical protein